MPVDERVARSVALEQVYVHDVYEQFYDNPRSKPWPRVKSFLEDLEPGSLICDVGCGNGKYLNVNKSVYNVGGDKSTRLAEVAREKENEIIILDNLALPYRDESLDAVLSIAVVHHLATTDRRINAIRELARVLRIGGRVIISVWAMEQTHRKFESQDVLVPWHRPQYLSTPSLELTSTTNTSEEDGFPPYSAYTQTSDSDSNKSLKSRMNMKKRGKGRHKGRSIDPCKHSSASSSSLSSPNETCYSFVRRAIQKLAGGRRVSVHRPWFLDSWTTCAKEPLPKRYDPDGCECCDCMENIQHLPIELRRIDEDVVVSQRRQTFPSSQLVNDISESLKSRSLTNIKTVENNNNIDATVPSEPDVKCETATEEEIKPKTTLAKPKLVKQKKSICDEDADEALDQPTDMDVLIKNIPDLRVFHSSRHRGSVFKQRSLNEELMSTDRLQEKERVRRNIQKQASLNDDLIYQRHTFDSFRESFFSVSTSKRFQLIKTGFTNKIKNSTTNIEKVTSQSLKNGFVRMFQNWKSSDLISPTIPEDETVDTKTINIEEKKELVVGERRHSKEDGSDSSKDSSLQSDTSVDSEDSFASVIFVPKSNPMSPTPLSPASPRMKHSSVPNSPRIKQSSCPTSPRIKQMPITLFPLTKQLSTPKPSTVDILDKSSDRDHITSSTTTEISKTLAQKYSVPQIPQFRENSINTPVNLNNNNNNTSSKTNISPEKSPSEKNIESRNERLKKIRDLLNQKPGFGVRSSKSNFPLVRHSSVTNGKVEAVGKPLPKLLSLELFNPETDDKDSDSSTVSSPDSVDSIVSVKSEIRKSPSKNKFKFPPLKKTTQNKLLEAAADVANSLDEAVDQVIKSSPKVKRRQLQTEEVLSIIQRSYVSDTLPLLSKEATTSWNEECHNHLKEFADKLSEKLLREIDQYQEKTKKHLDSTSLDNIDDPYIHRLSNELDDLSKLSAEIKMQNDYLAKLSASDSLFNRCSDCKRIDCKCHYYHRTKTKMAGVVEIEKKVPVEIISSKTDSLMTNTNEFVNNNGDKDKCREKFLIESEIVHKLPTSRNCMKLGTSSDSCDSERGSSTNSMKSSAAASINFGPSLESTDGFSDKTTSGESHRDSMSRCSNGGSTASLASCPDWKIVRTKSDNLTKNISSSNSLDSKTRKCKNTSLYSDTSQDSLPSDNTGGEITYHRFYHVFREGELDQLIEKYVENLHIISSYYDHASWCIIAEKVQVWTI